MTVLVAKNVTGNGDTAPVQVTEGQHFFGIVGTFDSAAVQIMVNIGPAEAVPITDAKYTAPASDIIWLPSCTLFLRLTGVVTACNITAALAEVSSKTE